MTLAEMKTYFDVLQDKPNSVYFTDAEKELFIDRAQITLLNEHMEREFPGHPMDTERAVIDARGVENTLGNTDILKPLIVSDMSAIDGGGTKLKTTANGVLSVESLKQAITNHSGKSVEPMKILSFAVDNGDAYPDSAEYVRINDIHKFLKNYFLLPATNSPVWTHQNDDYLFYPKAVHNIIASVVRYPISVVGGNNCELQNSTHDRIINIALELAEMASRDGTLMQIRQANTASR